MAACPDACVLTSSLALSAWPGVPGLSLTVTGWLKTTSEAGAVTAAEAWTTKNHQPPPAVRSRARTRTSRQPPHPNPQPRPKQPDFLAVGGGGTCWGAGGGGGGGGAGGRGAAGLGGARSAGGARETAAGSAG